MSFSLLKTIRSTLRINPIFKAPKTAPNNLLRMPRAAKLASFVSAFPAKLMSKTIITNVIAKATILTVFSFQSTLDSKNSETQNILKEAPKISDYLPKESLDLLNLIKDTFSNDCNIEIDHTLVRGLDYYTGFVFEAISSELGAQDAYLGGGRYDELCAQLGGKDLPAIGMAIGIERLASIANTIEINKTLVSFIILSNKIEQKAYKIAHDLRSVNKKLNLDIQLSEGSLKSKLRRANKDNASYALIVGEEELKSDTVIVKSLLDENSDQSNMNINELHDFIKSIE